MRDKRSKSEIKIGDKYGCLSIISLPFNPNPNHYTYYSKVRCDCGREFQRSCTLIFKNPFCCGRRCQIYLDTSEVPSKKMIVKPGTIINDMKFINVFYRMIPGKRKRRQFAEIECHCGNIFEQMVDCIKSGNTKSCGCRGAKKAKDGFKECFHCHKNLPITEYYKDIYKSDELCSVCRNCKSLACIKNKYDISKEDYQKILEIQDNKCFICGTNDPKHSKQHRLVIDHCHKTDKVRGILCNNCNTGIGALSDNIDNLLKAIEYLKNNPAAFLYQKE